MFVSCYQYGKLCEFLQIVVLTDKGSHDNELIMTLMRQQENLQKLVQHNMIAKEKVEQTGKMVRVLPVCGHPISMHALNAYHPVSQCVYDK